MNLNFPPIVTQEFYIDTDFSATGGWGPIGLMPSTQSEWLRDIEFEAQNGHVQPLHMDAPNLGNEGELLSIMAWMADDSARQADGSIVAGPVSKSCIEDMKIYFSAFNFSVIGTGIATPAPLWYPDPYHPPEPIDAFYISNTIYPDFGEFVDPTAFTPVNSTRTPFLVEHFSNPIPYKRGDKSFNAGQLGVGIVWRQKDPAPPNPRSIIKIKMTARRFR